MMKRQGDLLIVKVSSIPNRAVKKDHRILAEGEATGRMHELDSGELYEINDVMYFRVEEGARVVLKHPEHHHLTFEPGDYKVIRQREYEPNGWRHVAD